MTISRALLLLALFAHYALPLQQRTDEDFSEFDEEFEDDFEAEVGVDGVFDEDEGEFDEEDEEDGLAVEDEYDSEEFEEVPEEAGGGLKRHSDSLEISESAVRMKPVWEAYFGELCIVMGVVLYLVNYLLGRSRNSQLAQSWLTYHLQFLKDQFTIVGDDGEGDEPSEGHVIKRAEHSYTVWTSGRVNCDGLLVHMEFQRRHDLFSVVTGVFKPAPDTISYIFQLSTTDMEQIVFALAPRKTAGKMLKDYEDLSNFCSGLRSAEKFGLPSHLSILAESNEVASSVLSSSIVAYLSQHADQLLALHITDHYTGLKEEESDDSSVQKERVPEHRLHLTMTFLTDQAASGQQLQFAIVLLDHIRNIHLSREVKEKAQKNRSKVAQNKEKLQHQQRQEAAQQRKEEKRRAEKEKMMTETDPEKTRKWEEREHKRQMKKMNPRMKQMKVRVG